MAPNVVIDFIALTRPYETSDPFVRFDRPLGDGLQVMARGRRVEAVERQYFLREFDRQPIGHQGGKLRLEIKAFRGGALREQVCQGTKRPRGVWLTGTVEQPDIRQLQRPKHGPIHNPSGVFAGVWFPTPFTYRVLLLILRDLLGDHRALHTGKQRFGFRQREPKSFRPELLALQVGDVLDQPRGSTVRFDDDLFSDVHPGSPVRLRPLPGLVSTRILSEPAIDRRALNTLHREPVPKVVQLFHGLVVFPAFADLHQPLSDMGQGILLPQRHERPCPPQTSGGQARFPPIHTG
jgi:hypothetical protein